MTVRLALSAAVVVAAAGLAREARASGKPVVVVWPTLTPAGDAPGVLPLHVPQEPADKRDLFVRAQELDATLRDAVQDLGFTLAVAEDGPPLGHTRDVDILARAALPAAEGPTDEGGSWIISPRIEPASSGEFIVRIVAAPPQGRELRVRVETVTNESVSVRGLVMLRALLTPSAAAQATVERDREQAGHGSPQGIMSTLRSQGRAVLAVNAALFGGFAAYSLQRASNSTDPRVLYPLLAVGAGIGLGGALLVSEEWDVTAGDAWVLSAGGWWGAASAFLIAAGQNVQPLGDRYAWGIGGGLVGVSLATVALTQTPMDDGDAMLVHSGGAMGLLLGGATDLLYRGATTTTLSTNNGMGYGTAFGLLAAGALATRVTLSPSRVLLIDVGIGGGALLGAAAGSPLIFQNATKGNTRGWLSATIAGSIAGGVATWWLTRDTVPAPARSSSAVPIAGIVGESQTPQGAVPVYGVGVTGSF